MVTDPYLEPVLDGVVAFAQAHGRDLDSSMRRNGRLPAFTHLDGVIATIEHDETAVALARCLCPVVQVLDIRPTSAGRFPLVVPDYLAMGRLGAEHLLTLGGPQVAFYRRFDAPDSNAVRDGFLAAMSAAGRTVQALDFPQTYPGEVTHGPRMRIPLAQWEERLRRLLSWLPKPCAVMAEGDRCRRLCPSAGR